MSRRAKKGEEERKRLLHLKLRVVALEPMSESDMMSRIRRTLRTGVVQTGISLAWIDWARPRSMDHPPQLDVFAPLDPDTEQGKRYLGEDARTALVAFLGAVKDGESAVTIHGAEAGTPEPSARRRSQPRQPTTPLRDRGRPRAWRIENYNAFLREAKRVFGLSHGEAQALYREVRDYKGGPALGRDVNDYAWSLAHDDDAPEDSILYEPEGDVDVEPEGRRLGTFQEVEITARTYNRRKPEWRVEVVSHG